MRRAINAVGVIGCLLILAFSIWTVTIGGDIVSEFLQVQRAESDARIAEARAETEGALAEQAWAGVAQTQADSQADANAALIETLREELRRQGRRATVNTVMNKFLEVGLLANFLMWGLVSAIIIRDKNGR